MFRSAIAAAALTIAALAATPAQADEQPTRQRSEGWCEHRAVKAYHGQTRDGLHCYPLNPDRDWWNCVSERRGWFYVTCG